MFDAIVEGVLEIVVRTIIQPLGWCIGWVFWRAITFGYFPRCGIKEMGVPAGRWITALLIATGWALMIAIPLGIFIYLDGRA